MMFVFFNAKVSLRGGPLWSGFDERIDHASIIRDSYTFLLDKLKAINSGLINKLHQAKVLNVEEKKSISAKKTSWKQNEKLLSMLSRKTKDQFNQFLHALVTTEQQHIHDHCLRSVCHD